MNTTFKTLGLTALGCLLVGFLLGFVPEYIAKSHVEQQVMDLNSHGETVQQSLNHTEGQLRLNEFALQAAVVSADANSSNYADAAKSASALFTGLRNYVDNAKDDGATEEIKQVLAMRDTTISALAKADPGVRPTLVQIFQKLKGLTSQSKG